MASSQVEIPTSSRFGHVLRDRNHQPISYRGKDSPIAFQKHFSDLVQTHLNSCISSNSSNSNLNQRMDYADLWVHKPQGPNNVNNIDSAESVSNRISDDSNANEGSNQRIDYTDLWVHIPERNNVENDHVRNNASGKWDRGRDVVISIQRKSRDGMLSEPVSNSVRGESKNDAKSEPLSIWQKGNSKIKGEKTQNGRKLEPVRTRQREKLPAQSECSVEVQNFCGVSSLVSSLVQKWRGYEAEGKSSSTVNSPVCGSKVNSGLFFADAECPSFNDDPVKSFNSLDGSSYLKPVTPMTNEDSFADWESCKTGLSGPPSSVGRDSDATESERIRVADIIKKLSSSVEELTVVHEPRVKISCDHQAEQRTFSPVSHSPRIRGRQVFCDLLMHMERERHRELEDLKECKAVSRFSHKGRIQATLRLRLLRYGSELKDAPCSNYSLPDRNRNEPAILRKRLNSVQVDQVRVSDMTSQATEKSCDASASREGNGLQLGTELATSLADRNSDAECSSESNPTGGRDINNHESMAAVHQSDIHPNSLEILHQDHSNSSFTLNSTTSDSSTQILSEFAVEEISLQDNGENSGINFLEAHIPIIESINVISSTRGDKEEQEADTQNLVVSDCEWTSDVSQPPCEEWEELHSDCMQLEDFNQDWISDVSRPRSDWEYLRQARYQEMCDPFRENADIRSLLERKSVSSFLSSGLRDRIDQLMVARTHNSIEPAVHAKVGGNSTQMEEEQEVRLQEEEKLHEGRGEEAEERQEECVGCNSGYKEVADVKLCQNREAANYANETMSWVRDNVSSDNHSDQAASPYIEGSPLSSTYTQETEPSPSFNNNNSIGIELMYELRGNMQQLRQEVAELRKSMKSMNMQIELHKPYKKEVAPSFGHSGRKKRKDAPLTPKFNDGRCCICHDTHIDTLLYRCGHMCTCFNCAQELQWSTGKCPVCRTPILDIVKAHFHP